MDSKRPILAQVHGVTTPWGNDIWSRPTLETIDKKRFSTTFIGYYDSYWLNRNLTFKALAGPLHLTSDAFFGTVGSPVRILPQTVSFFSRARLRQSVREKDIHILMTHSYLPGLPKTARRLGVRSVLWSIDDPMQHCPLWFSYAREFDVVLTMSYGSIADYKENGIEKVFFFPWAADTRIFGTMNDVDRDIDISFAGTKSPDRAPGIQGLLWPLINHFQDRFYLYGHGWKNFGPCTIHGEVRDLDAAALFSRSKIALNFHREPARKKSCTLRPSVFEAMACNTLVACDEALGLEHLFEPGRELIVLNRDNVIELTEYYLRETEEARKIARAGYDKVMRNHTVLHRARELEDILTSIS